LINLTLHHWSVMDADTTLIKSVGVIKAKLFALPVTSVSSKKLSVRNVACCLGCTKKLQELYALVVKILGSHASDVGRLNISWVRLPSMDLYVMLVHYISETKNSVMVAVNGHMEFRE